MSQKKPLAYMMYVNRNAPPAKKKADKEEESKKNAIEGKQIAKDIATAVVKKADMPFKRHDFRTLTDYALEVVAANFERYPSLKGLGEPFRTKV
jgi:hypothetical protein